MCYVCSFHNVKDNPPQNHRRQHLNYIFIFLFGVKMETKMCFIVLEVWQLDLGVVLEIMLQEFVRALFE